MRAPEQSPPPLNVSQALQQAQAFYRAGQWVPTEELCRRILDAQVDQHDALILLGIIAAQTQRLEEAEQLLGRAAAARPEDAAGHFNHGNVLIDLGRFEDALTSYRQAAQLRSNIPEHHYACGNALRTLARFEQALASYDEALSLRPGYAEAHLNRGATLETLGRLEEALASYGRALQARPTYADASYNRGLLLQNQGRLEEALRDFDRALQIHPTYAEAHCNRGHALRQLNHSDEALKSYEQALQLQPQYAEVHVARGATLQGVQRFEEALASYEEAIRINPQAIDAYNNRGTVLQDLQRFEEALASYESAIRIRPDFVEAHNNRGTALQDLLRLEDALASYEEALRLNPKFMEAHLNSGSALHDMLRTEAAVASFDQAIALQPEHARAHEKRALAALLGGDFERGWADFEWRWKNEHSVLCQTQPRFRQPRWLGNESLAGKTLLLHHEQGFGDTLQFCRYAPLVAQRGARVILVAPPELRRVLMSLEGVQQVVVPGEVLPPFDYHCPLMSLPLAFGTTLSNIPAQVPYLKADPARVAAWRERLGERRGMRVGLVWSGGFRPNQPQRWSANNRRNISLEKLAPLRQAGIDFYSLQKGEPAESELAGHVARGWGGPHLIDFTGELKDFADTAALLENLDLLISVDTATAHLAGAQGRPVWLLNRYNTCWRWLLERTDSPWYPTLRQYRQRQSGDWSAVIEHVAADLCRQSESHGRA